MIHLAGSRAARQSAIPFAPAMLAASFAPLIFVALFLGFLALALVAARRQQRLILEQMTGLASRFGLQLMRKEMKLGFEPAPTVEGRYRNRPVRFFNYTTGAGKSRTRWSAVSAAVPGAGGFTLELAPENFLTHIATTLGMQDLQIGDPAFDRAFVVRSNDATYAVASLLPEIRTRLLLAGLQHSGRGQLTIKDGEARYAEVGEFDDAARVARLAGMLETACDLAEVAEVYQA
jgi:hypothetical protein